MNLQYRFEGSESQIQHFVSKYYRNACLFLKLFDGRHALDSKLGFMRTSWIFVCVVCVHNIEINYNILMKNNSNEFSDPNGREV